MKENETQMESLVIQLRTLMGQGSDQEIKPLKLFEQVLRSLDQGDNSRALKVLYQLLEYTDWQGENRAATYHLLGDLYSEAGETQKAEEYYFKTLEIPNWQGINRASTLHRMGELRKALNKEDANDFFQAALDEPALTPTQRADIEENIKNLAREK